jgi:hypothetical protein
VSAFLFLTFFSDHIVKTTVFCPTEDKKIGPHEEGQLFREEGFENFASLLL